MWVISKLPGKWVIIICLHFLSGPAEHIAANVGARLGLCIAIFFPRVGCAPRRGKKSPEIETSTPHPQTKYAEGKSLPRLSLAITLLFSLLSLHPISAAKVHAVQPLVRTQTQTRKDVKITSNMAKM